MIPARIPPVESVVQAGVVSLFRACGFEVWSSSQYRASHVAEGYPDLWVMHRGAPGLAFYFETKRPQPTAAFDPFNDRAWTPEPLQPAQALFRAYCLEAGIRHYWGGVQQAREALIDLGLAAYSSDGIFTLFPATWNNKPPAQWLSTLKHLRDETARQRTIKKIRRNTR